MKRLEGHKISIIFPNSEAEEAFSSSVHDP